VSYLYIKKQPGGSLVLWRLLRFVPVLVFTAGLLALSYAGWPLVSYQLRSWRKFQNNYLVKPYASIIPAGLNEEDQGGSLFSVSGASENLAHIQNWLPPGSSKSFSNRVDYYSLSIPSLEIFNAVVRVGGEDLSSSLIHYGGTAYPGDFGNAVIFGHSILPQFFNPANYMTIFALLPTLKYGDEIIINFDGVRYCYHIEEMVEVKPDDLSILEQRFDDSYISLVTCVPPGTYLRRLVVRARLVR